MGKSNKMNNSEDVRRTVRNRRQKNKIVSFKPIIIIIVAIAIVVGIAFAAKQFTSKKKIVAKQITNYNYFISMVDEKAGVIDKAGKAIIEPEYDYIQIPNPEKPVFICLYDYNTDESEYSSKVLDGNGKEILTKYNKIQAIPNNKQ